jgi:signal transduction histidine kinase
LLNAGLLAFQTLKHGAVAINGSTGMILGRSLMALRDLIDSTLAEVRLGAGIHRRQRLAVAEFVDEIAVVANLHAEYRDIRFVVPPVDRKVAVNADPELLASAVTNLLNNAFKYTQAGGRVALSVNHDTQRVMIAVEDECGGIQDAPADRFMAFGERRGRDRSGLGLGLSIARKAVKANGGEIHIRNIPGTGCVFTIEMPVAEEANPPAAVL